MTTAPSLDPTQLDRLTILPKTPKLIGLASDHGGYELKEYLLRMLREAGHVMEQERTQWLSRRDHQPYFLQAGRNNRPAAEWETK